jgi:hypothetical protein
MSSANLRSYYKTKYGLTPEQVETMRGDGCGICQVVDDPTDRWGTLHVDHDHATGRVRGVLCNGCNNGLGRFKDDPALLRAAADYLERAAALT